MAGQRVILSQPNVGNALAVFILSPRATSDVPAIALS